jgi:hypothetical protein
MFAFITNMSTSIVPCWKSFDSVTIEFEKKNYTFKSPMCLRESIIVFFNGYALSITPTQCNDDPALRIVEVLTATDNAMKTKTGQFSET